MQFAFKGMVAVAALAVAGAASADDFFPPMLNSGTGTWTLSGDALSSLSAAGAMLRTPAVLPTVAGLPGGGSSNSAAYARETGEVSLNFSAVTPWDFGTLTSLQAANSLLQLRRTTFEEDGNNDGAILTRSIYLVNLDLNPSNSTLYADLYARNETTKVLTSFGKQAIFQADVVGIVGGTQGQIVYSDDWRSVMASGTLAGGLRLNQNAANIILGSLGVSTDEAVAHLWRESSWGSVSFTASAVPEPSGVALFGFGLLSLGLWTRRGAARAS